MPRPRLETRRYGFCWRRTTARDCSGGALTGSAKAIVALLTLLSAPVAAQNLVTNPGFDLDTSGWASFTPKIVLSHALFDATAEPESGSALATVVTAEGVNSGFGQCVPIEGGRQYDFGATIWVPSGAARGQTFLLLSWYGSPDCSDSPIDTVLVGPGESDRWVPVSRRGVAAPLDAQGALVFPKVIKNLEDALPYQSYFDDLFLSLSVPGRSYCAPGEHVLCIDDQPGDRRFQVQVDYETAQGGGDSGRGTAIPLANLGIARGGLFWFFSADNPEMVIKVLNACFPPYERYWVFYSAGTNVGLTVTVTDLFGGRVWTESNPDLVPAVPVLDTDAFPCDGG